MKTFDLLDRCLAPSEGWGSRGAWVTWIQMLPVLAFMALVFFCNLSHAGTISPRRLLEVADFGPPVVSPNGRHVAFRIERASIERNTYDSVWYVQDMDGGGVPRRVADGGVPLRDAAGVSLPATATWSPDGRWIYYRALMDGKIDVWRAAADGSGAEPMTLDAADVRGFTLSEDGRRLIYSVGATRELVVEAEQAEYDGGIRVDKDVPIGQGLFRSINIEGRWETQRYAGMWFGRAPLLADAPDRWKAIDLASRERLDLPESKRPPHPLKASDLAAGLPRPWKLAVESGSGRVALLTRVGNADGFREGLGVQLSVLPSRGATQPIACTSDLCTDKAISGIQWRPGRDEVLFTVTDPKEGLAQSIFRWNVRSGGVRLVVHARGLVSGGRDRFTACGTSEVALACVAAEADQPPRLERIDLATGHRQILFDPNAALAADMAATARPRNGSIWRNRAQASDRSARAHPPSPTREQVMRKILIVVLGFALGTAAQASSTLRVGSQVLVAGDSQERVVELLGKPSSKVHPHRARHSRRRVQVLERTDGGERWRYRREGHITVVTIVDGRVVDIDDRKL